MKNKFWNFCNAYVNILYFKLYTIHKLYAAGPRSFGKDFKCVGKNWGGHPEKPIAFLYGFPVEKRTLLAQFLPEFRLAFANGKSSVSRQRLHMELVFGLQPHFQIIAWEHRERSEIRDYAKKRGLTIWRMEDGFIRPDDTKEVSGRRTSPQDKASGVGAFSAHFKRVGKNWEDHPEKPIAFLYGFPLKTRAILAQFLPEFRLAFANDKRSFSRQRLHMELVAGLQPHFQVVAWGHSERPEVCDYAEKRGLTVWRMGDGFIQSAHRETEHASPISLVLDKNGMHYDAEKGSDLETLLQNYDFSADPSLMARARGVIARFRAGEISMYEYTLRIEPQTPRGEKTRRRVLVVGWMAGDVSVSDEEREPITNLDLLQRVCAEEHDAEIWFHSHSDIPENWRETLPDARDVDTRVKFLDTLANLHETFKTIDHVYTIASLAGFEALLHHVPVTVFGTPFYAGWRLTDARTDMPGRSRRLSAEAIFAAAYLLYPRYLDSNQELCTPEVAISRISAIRTFYRKLVVLRKQPVRLLAEIEACETVLGIKPPLWLSRDEFTKLLNISEDASNLMALSEFYFLTREPNEDFYQLLIKIYRDYGAMGTAAVNAHLLVQHLGIAAKAKNFLLLAQLQRKNGDLKSAFETLSSAHSKFPGDKSVSLHLAEVFFAMDDLEQATSVMDDLLPAPSPENIITPIDFRSLIFLIRLCVTNRNIEKAETLFKTALAHQDATPQSLLSPIEWCAAVPELEELVENALADMIARQKTRCEQAPEKSKELYHLARLCSLQGDLEAADKFTEEYYVKASAANDVATRVGAEFDFAHWLHQCNDPDAAVEHLHKVVAIDDSSATLLRAARDLEKFHRREEALPLFRLLRARHPTEAYYAELFAHFLYNNYLFDAGLYNEAFSIEAKELLTEVLEREPYRLASIYGLGMLHLVAGDKLSAQRYLEYGHKLAPWYVDILFGLAQLHEEADDLEAAGDYYSQALKLQFRHRFAYQAVTTYRMAEKHEEAHRLYSRLAAEMMAFPALLKRSKGLNGARSVLILLSGGPGDQIRYASFLHHVMSRVERCTISCEARVRGLLERSFPSADFISVPQSNYDIKMGKDQWISSRSQVPKKYRLSFLSKEVYDKLDDYDHVVRGQELLNSFFAGEPNPLARVEGFIEVSSLERAFVRGLLATHCPEGRLRVGVTWRSARRVTAPHIARYITDVHSLRSIFGVPGVSFINLQHGITEMEKDVIQNEYGADFTCLPDVDIYNDQERLAALLKELDYVICGGHSVRDLAGAVGATFFPLLWRQARRWTSGASARTASTSGCQRSDISIQERSEVPKASPLPLPRCCGPNECSDQPAKKLWLNPAAPRNFSGIVKLT